VRVILGERSRGFGNRNVYTRAPLSRRVDRAGILERERERRVSYFRVHRPDSGSASAQGFIASARWRTIPPGGLARAQLPAKKDRLDLLRSTRAHCGQLFMLYSDRKAPWTPADAAAAQPPLPKRPMNTAAHRLWKIAERTDPAADADRSCSSPTAITL